MASQKVAKGSQNGVATSVEEAKTPRRRKARQREVVVTLGPKGLSIDDSTRAKQIQLAKADGSLLKRAEEYMKHQLQYSAGLDVRRTLDGGGSTYPQSNTNGRTLHQLIKEVMPHLGEEEGGEQDILLEAIGDAFFDPDVPLTDGAYDRYVAFCDGEIYDY